VTTSDRIARAANRRSVALKILDTLGLPDRWRPWGTPILVGAVALDLVVEPDIDFEIYAPDPAAAQGFAALTPCVDIPGVRRLRFLNALDTPDLGLYWRLDYETGGETWKVDMWFLADDHPSPRAASLVEPLLRVLTGAHREAILAVKEGAARAATPIAGVWVYQAVIDHGVRSYPEFVDWQAKADTTGLTDWLPQG
jgi:hypothetical protein